MNRSHDLALDLLDLSSFAFKIGHHRFGLLLSEISEMLSSDPTSQIHVFLHHSDPVRMNSAKLSILKESDQERLCCLLESQNCKRLKPQLGTDRMSNLSKKTLEWSPLDEKLSAFLIPLDLA